MEFKYTTGTVYLNHKYQVVAYAMLLEERFARPVRYGYIYRVPNDDIQVIEITPNTRDFVMQTMDFIREMLANEKMPPPTRARGKCLDCEFRHFCGDVL